MLTLHKMKKVLNTSKPSTPENDFKILDSWTEVEEGSTSKDAKLKYLCYKIETIDPESGDKNVIYKAVKFARVMRLPKSAKQSTSFMDMQSQVLAAVYEQGYNLVTVIANVIRPTAEGLMYLYGVQGVADNIDEAKKRASSDFSGFIGSMMGTFRVLHIRTVTVEEGAWLAEKMRSMKFMTAVRGIPKANTEGEDMGNKGVGGTNLNPDSQGTLEELITAMADQEYVIEVLSTPVYMRTLMSWSSQTQKQMTEWYGQLQGTKSLSFNLSIPMTYMTATGSSQGWSKNYTDSRNVSYTQGESYNTGYSENVGSSIQQSLGQSFGISRGHSLTDSVGENSSVSNGVTRGHTVGETNGITHGQTYGETIGHTTGITRGYTQGVTKGTSSGFTIGENQGNNYGKSVGESLGESTNKSFSSGASSSQSVSQGSGKSYSENFGQSSNKSLGQSSNTSYGESQNISHSQGTSQNRSFSAGESHSTGTSSSISGSHGGSESSSSSDGGSTSWSNGTSSNLGFSSGEGKSDGGTQSLTLFAYNHGGNHSTTTNAGASYGLSKSSSEGGSTTWSDSHSTGTSWSNSSSYGSSTNDGYSESQSQGYGASESFSSGSGSSYSEGHGTSYSEGFGNSYSKGENLSYSNSNSSSVGQTSGVSDGYGSSKSSNLSENTGQSYSMSISKNQGTSFSSSMSQSVSQSESVSNSKSSSVSQSNSYSQSVSDSSSTSQSVSNGQSKSRSVGESDSQSYTQSLSNGLGKSWGQSTSVGKGQSYGTSEGESQGTSMGSSGTFTTGTSGSMGLGPSIGYSKSYQWMDQQVKDILELLEYQNERLKKALRGNGAFYTYVYIACDNMDALATAQAAAKSTWQNTYAMTQPIQVLDLTDEEQQHLLYHFRAFSADVTREVVSGVSDYKYATVLLPDEYVAYTHLPRVSEGGIDTNVDDVPKFRVPGLMRGGIYMGTQLNAERYTFLNGYRTQFDYRLSIDELMHGICTGQSRSGKTVAAMRFIRELANARRTATNKRLRIVIMDPKQDWRGIARFVEPERFRFYSMGNTHFHPINLNPCKIPYGVEPQHWIDGIINIYCRAYGLLERGKQMLSDVFYALYNEQKIFDEKEANKHGGPESDEWKREVSRRSGTVTFHKVYKKMEQTLGSFNGKDKKAGNDTLDAYSRLLERPSCFARPYSIEYRLFSAETDFEDVESKGIGYGIDELIGADDVTVFESFGLESTFANFIFGIITSGFYKVAKSFERGYLNPAQFETVLVIEEANKVLTGNDTAGSGGQQSVSLSGQSEFEEILDQSAGYGLFIFAITQKPSMMPSSIIANCGLLFMGRLTQPEDVNLGVRMIGREERIEDRDIVKWLPKSPTGWFICRSSRGYNFLDAEPVLVQIEPLNNATISNAELNEILVRKRIAEYVKGSEQKYA